MSRVLIVAPEPDLRRSLQFALEADGHAVSSYSGIVNRAEFEWPFDCTILDGHAVAVIEDALSFCRDFEPVILLVSRPEHPLSPRVFETLYKPMLGPALTLAVRRAVDLGGAPK